MPTATILPEPRFVAFDANGNPLSGGFVYTYVPGGTTPKITWQDAAETIPNSVPIVLDSAGSAAIYGSGVYSIVTTDALGNQVPAYTGLSTDTFSPFASLVASAVTSIATIAALQAATTATLPQSQVYVLGYYGPADGGEGMFTVGANAAANGGTIINDASGRSWYREISGQEISIRWFGCKPDLTADCSAQLLACITFAAGRTIYAQVGEYAVHSTVTYTGPINLRGDGNGCGPGPAAISNTGCTQFLLYGAATGLCNATTNAPCAFRAFQINVEPGSRPHSGVGISISGPIGSTNANSVIEEVGFSNVSNPILYTRTAVPKTHNNYFDSWIFGGMYIQTSAGLEGNGGDISGNFFFGPASASGTQGPAIDCETGYIDVHDNLFTGGAGAVNLNFRNFPAGAPNIHDNVIEDYRLYGVQVSSADGNTASMVRIHDNEFSNVSFTTNKIADILVTDFGADFVVDLQIRGNVIRSVGGAGSSFINVQSGQNVLVSDNVLDNLGAAINAGIAVSGGFVSNTAAVTNNLLRGSYTAKYILQNIVVLRDVTSGMAVADLGTWGNGSEVYVVNGHATNLVGLNLTVTTGGPGCTAWRMNGAWLTIQS